MDRISFALQICVETGMLTRNYNHINCTGTTEIKFVVTIDDVDVLGSAIYFHLQ